MILRGGAPMRVAPSRYAALQPRPADDPQHAVRLDVQSPPRHVRGLDARPRLGQRNFRVTQPLGHRDRVAPLIAVQRGRAQQAVLRQPAGEDVAVGQVAPAIVEVGLQCKALAGPETIAPRLADLHHGHRDLVALDDRPPGQVAAVEPRVAPALADDLDIGIAQPHGVGTHEDLIRRGARGRPTRRLALHAEVLDPGAEERPGEHGVGDAVEVRHHVCVSYACRICFPADHTANRGFAQIRDSLASGRASRGDCASVRRGIDPLTRTAMPHHVHD